MNKKSDAQREVEIKALQAFILECERRKIYIKPILKELTFKTLRMINIRLDKGL